MSPATYILREAGNSPVVIFGLGMFISVLLKLPLKKTPEDVWTGNTGGPGLCASPSLRVCTCHGHWPQCCKPSFLRQYQLGQVQRVATLQHALLSASQSLGRDSPACAMDRQLAGAEQHQIRTCAISSRAGGVHADEDRLSSLHASYCDRNTSPLSVSRKWVAFRRSMTGPLTSDRWNPTSMSFNR